MAHGWQGATPVCQAGVCRTCEEAGYLECDGECIRGEVDDESCGECGNTCPDGTQCVDGTCTVGECDVECAAGSACCNHPWGGIRGCADLRSDPFNCGACGQRCLFGEDCVEGSCGCAPWLTNCDGYCADTQSDPANCSECGVECGAGSPLCSQGECTGCEEWGAVECGGGCVWIDWDPQNCGGCGDRCDEGEYCYLGDCYEEDGMGGGGGMM